MMRFGKTERWRLGKAFVPALALFVLLLPAAFGAPVHNNNVEAELVSDVSSIQPGTPFSVAIRLAMDEEWHVYWKNPGDSGLATDVEWILPPGLRAGSLEWPYPERISTPPFFTFGYEGEVFLLAQITPSASLPAGSDEFLQANVSWLSCKEVCVPGSVELELALPILNELPAPNEKWKEKFIEAKRTLPQEPKGWQARAEKTGRKFLLRIAVPAPLKFELEDLDFFPLMHGMVEHGRPVFKMTAEELQIELVSQKQFPGSVENIEGVLVSKNGWDDPAYGPAFMIDAAVKKKSNWFQ